MPPIRPVVAILLLALSAPLAALEIHDDDQLSLTFGAEIQTRVETAYAHTSTGQSYDIYRGEIGKSDELQYSMRRARLIMDGRYGPHWRFLFEMAADNIDRDYYNQNNTAIAASSSGGRQVALFKAYVRRNVPLDDRITMGFQAGLDYPYFNRAITNNACWLFPQQRATGNLMGVRGVGGRWNFSGPRFDCAIDVQEGLDQDRGNATAPAGAATPGAAPTGNAGEREGMVYTARVEFLAFNNGREKPVYRESYKGAGGRSLLLAIDGGLDNRDFQEPGTRMDSECFGAEALLHVDRLSALIDSRFLNIHEDADVNGGAYHGHDNAEVILAQAGYAIPVDGITVEPAARYAWIDNNVGNRDTIPAYNGGAVNGTMAIPGSVLQNSVGNPDGSNSGIQIDAGANFYLNRIMQMSLYWSHWKAKTGDASANIFRSQFQVAF